MPLKAAYADIDDIFRDWENPEVSRNDLVQEVKLYLIVTIGDSRPILPICSGIMTWV
jgi:hypothetical protein